ncbi:hypothetical protein SKAU_G00340960 [Synaphobranchus kaupii]|uniref:Uncharacterized protein n=1 Tax=Synaphobranchus kaupii TaxID=118154 RepID=A0A9Q1III3_SYNKA|nr:hypothetical protein SKAU_G00340960 [Synaphobranchus kaupii]
MCSDQRVPLPPRAPLLPHFLRPSAAAPRREAGLSPVRHMASGSRSAPASVRSPTTLTLALTRLSAHTHSDRRTARSAGKGSPAQPGNLSVARGNVVTSGDPFVIESATLGTSQRPSFSQWHPPKCAHRAPASLTRAASAWTSGGALVPPGSQRPASSVWRVGAFSAAEREVSSLRRGGNPPPRFR